MEALELARNEPLHGRPTLDTRVVSSIFYSNGASSASRSAPAEHIGTPVTPERKARQASRLFNPPSPSPSRHCASPAGRRIPISLPVQVSFPTSNIVPARTQSNLTTTSQPVFGPTEDTDILTLLATQERRVLELKESLQKAEEGLAKLKSQWAAHESGRRRNDVRRIHQMRTISASTTSKKTGARGDDDDGSSAWMYDEMARRKALIGHTKTSQGRVFSGSKQTKQLSLLKNTLDTSQPPAPTFPPTRTSTTTNALDIRRSRDPTRKRLPTPRAHSSISPTVEPYPTLLDSHASQLVRTDSRSPQREMLVQAGRQMATDLRQGLWTFLDDLRHAAIGEDPRSLADQRLQPVRRPTEDSRHSRRTPSSVAGIRPSEVPQDERRKNNDTDTAFWQDQAVERPLVRRASKPVRTTPQRPVVGGDMRAVEPSWEAWASPLRSASSTSAFSSAYSPSPDLLGSSPSTSVTGSYDTRRREAVGVNGSGTPRSAGIEWPPLQKEIQTAGQLRRTAENLMEEWDRSQ